MRYEKPSLVALSQKALGDVQDQGNCTNGSNPGVQFPTQLCGNGFQAAPNGTCTQGNGVH